MKKLALYTLLGLCGFAALTANAETRYITDKVYVPLRVGDGTKFRIIHKGLPSGTRLDLLETREASGYARVRTASGIEGWLPAHYLVSTPVARTRLDEANSQIDKLKADNTALSEKLAALNSETAETGSTLEQLQQENSTLSDRLQEIQRVSANAIKLDEDNRRLLESNQMLSNEVDVLKTDNARLRENDENEFFLNGAFAVILGVLIALVIPRLAPKKRSEWV